MKRQPKPKSPLESAEGIALADCLRYAGICFTYNPIGEGKLPIWLAVRIKKMGVQKGFPDFQIFDPPPGNPTCWVGNYYSSAGGRPGICRGVFIEMKRTAGGAVSPEQLEWQRKLQSLGYVSLICYGFAGAHKQLTELGYDLGKVGAR